MADNAGHKYLLYEEYEENKYSLAKQSEKYLKYHAGHKLTNYLLIVEPIQGNA